MTQSTLEHSARTVTGGRLEIRRFAPNLGATISGVDLSRPVDDQTRASLQQALLDHGVLFFRDQKLSPQQVFDAVETQA